MKDAIKRRDSNPRCLGCTSSGRDDAQRRRPCSPKILVGQVQDALVVGVGVDGGHQRLLDAEGIAENFGHRSNAVGGARGIGQDVVLLRVVLILVHPQDNGQIGALGRS